MYGLTANHTRQGKSVNALQTTTTTTTTAAITTYCTVCCLPDFPNYLAIFSSSLSPLMAFTRIHRHHPCILHLFFFIILVMFLPLSQCSSIHDLLISKGLPAGLLPKDVRSFNLSESGLLQVFLDEPCLTKFDTNIALYESEVRANLTYGSLTGVQGLSQEELFLWLPVKDIIVDDPSSGVILVDIGLAHKQLSLSLFEDPPDCAAKSVWDWDWEEKGRADQER